MIAYPLWVLACIIPWALGLTVWRHQLIEWMVRKDLNATGYAICLFPSYAIPLGVILMVATGVGA